MPTHCRQCLPASRCSGQASQLPKNSLSASIHCPCRIEEPYAGHPLTAQNSQGPAAGGLAPVKTVAVPAPLKTEADMAAHPEGPVGASQKAPTPQAAASKGSPLARGVQAFFDGYAGCCGRMNMQGEQPLVDVHLHCAQLSCCGTQVCCQAIRAALKHSEQLS